MKSFEILLDQDSNLKLEEQESVLRGIVGAYAKLRLDHKVDDDTGARQQGPNDDEDKDLKLQLSQLDARLRQLTNRVEVCLLVVLHSLSVTTPILPLSHYCFTVELYKMIKGFSAVSWSQFFTRSDASITRGHNWKLRKKA